MAPLLAFAALGPAWASALATATSDPPALASTTSPAAEHDQSTPLASSIGFETVRLPGGERMGLASGTLLFGIGSDWWIGPAVYGAASGHRGGLFAGGAELQRRWRLGQETIVAGVFAGGGGGAAAPVGGGLMLRPALTWLHDIGPMQFGVSWSAVRFPGGDISSREWGLVVAWDGRFRYAQPARAGSAARDPERSGVGIDRLVGTVSSYSLRGGGVAPRRIGLVGARLVQDSDRAPWGDPSGTGTWHWGLETAGAASGGAAGYMEILGTLGWDTPVDKGGAWRVGVRGALGLAGGGAVPTGGGAIAKLGLSGSVKLSPTMSAGVELGWLGALDTTLRAPTAQAWFAWALEPPPRTDGIRVGTFERTEWTAALQHYTRADRRDGSRGTLDTVGLKLSRFIDDHVYGTVQAHSAYAGGAGAYSIGLVGAGIATAAPRDAGWRAGAELLAGAAGGGGVDSGGGAIAQGVAWAGWSLAPGAELRVGAGAVRSRARALSSPIVELSLSRAFGQAAP